MADLAEEPVGPAPAPRPSLPLIWGKKEEVTQGEKKVGSARKTKLLPPPPPSRSGSATGISFVQGLPQVAQSYSGSFSKVSFCNERFSKVAKTSKTLFFVSLLFYLI